MDKAYQIYVSGIEIRYLTPVICSVCIFYTALGGFKAVVWTDALQFIFMFSSIFIVMILGIISVGGLERIWEINYQGGRLNIDFDLDITKRDTFWCYVTSYTLIWMSLISVSQSAIQKYLSLPSYKEVKRAACISTVGLIILVGLTFFTGLIIYGKYYNCDPLKSRQISAIDQILPYFVLDVGGKVMGVAGLFVSGILSASLSTLSATLNCLSATIYEDFISPFVAPSISQERISLLLKIIVLTIGIICTGMVYVVEQMDTLLPFTVACISLTAAPLLGVFTTGMLLPMVNTKGIMVGGITSLLVLGWIIFGTQWYRYKKILQYPGLSTSVEGCSELINMTLPNMTNAVSATHDDVLFVYRISHNHHPLIGVITVAVVSTVVSYFTKNKKERVNKDCITPLAHFLIPQQDQLDYSGDSLKKDEEDNILLNNIKNE